MRSLILSILFYTLGLFTGIGLAKETFTPKTEAIKSGCAEYDSTTGKFQWKHLSK